MIGMKILWLLLLSLASSSFALSETPYESGNAFLRVCSAVDTKNPNPLEMANNIGCASYVSGYIDGLTNGIEYSEAKTGQKIPKLFCLPAEIEAGQTIRILLKYIRDNPAEDHELTAILLIFSLKKAYPCK